MDWWFVIGILAAAALAYAYREHTSQRRQLETWLASIAEGVRGEITPGSWLVLPQLRFERDGAHYLVAAMANSGAHAGASGPFTFVEVALPTDPGATFRERTREKLRESRLPNLELRLQDRKLSVHMDGIASSREELEALIETASLLARDHADT